MAEYYLISQLPSLDGINENTPLPITSERFSELCCRYLGKKALTISENLTLMPSKDFENTSSSLVNKWNEGEKNLRLILAGFRAEKLNKNFEVGNQCFPVELIQAMRTAVDIESPMEAEKYLNRYRLDFLETLRPMDSFSEEFVFYYALKLKLIERIRKFDTENGEIAYRIIYDSIINKDRSEVM